MDFGSPGAVAVLFRPTAPEWSMGDARGSIPVRPAGFPACRTCSYLRGTEPGVCVSCCASRLPALAGRRCQVCDQPLRPGQVCANDWCSRADRWFSSAWAIAPHIGDWRWAIARAKYQGDTAFAEVFGRVLVGHLDRHSSLFGHYDLIVPVPAYCGPGARRTWDHVGALVAAAARLAGTQWPFGSGSVTKVSETPALTGQSRSTRRAYAEGPLRRALRVPDPAAVASLRVLVVDDVFTEGRTLREVARALILAGAVEVAGLALARQPWQPRPAPTSGPGRRAAPRGAPPGERMGQH
jgi:predicted amidophosphoribosyltransferase